MYIVYNSDQCATRGSLVRPLCHPLQLQVGTSGLWYSSQLRCTGLYCSSQQGIINDVPLHWRWLMIFTLTVGHAVPRHGRGRRSGHPGGGAGAGAHCDAYRRYGPWQHRTITGIIKFYPKIIETFFGLQISKKPDSNTYNLLLNILAFTIFHHKITFYCRIELDFIQFRMRKGLWYLDGIWVF